MKTRTTSWDNILDDVQLYISCNVIPISTVYMSFLEKIKEEECKNQLCLLPLARLEIYNLTFNKNLCKKQQQSKNQSHVPQEWAM